MEPQIISALPSFQMVDYKVDYTNHSQFQQGNLLYLFKMPKKTNLITFTFLGGRKQGSPVRIFTNVNLERLELPSNEGYHFCFECRRWTSLENQHCADCGSCTSKVVANYCILFNQLTIFNYHFFIGWANLCSLQVVSEMRQTFLESL